jgi:hypothetical protein
MMKFTIYEIFKYINIKKKNIEHICFCIFLKDIEFSNNDQSMNIVFFDNKCLYIYRQQKNFYLLVPFTNSSNFLYTKINIYEYSNYFSIT